VPAAIPSAALRDDAIRLVVGELILGAGLVAIILHWFRPRTADRSTLYFGLASFLYGLRLIVEMRLLESAFPSLPWRAFDSTITLTVSLPFILYFGSTIARAYPWFTRVMVALSAILAVWGAVALLRHAPLDPVWDANALLIIASVAGYGYIAIVPRFPVDREVRILRMALLILGIFVLYQNLTVLSLLPRMGYWEPLGTLVLLGCFFYISAARGLRAEANLIAIRNELEIARQIQLSLLPPLNRAMDGFEIHACYAPAGSVAGDFYDVLSDDHGLGVLIADVSGHGVPAALSASVLKVALHTQGGHVASPAELLAGLNRSLSGALGDQFITAAYVFVDAARRELRYSGAGHPPLMLWRSATRQVEDLEQNGLFLGPFPQAQYSTLRSPFEPGDRCLLYTDGLVEAAGAANEEFGAPRLRDFLAAHSALPPGSVCTALLDRVTAWSGGASHRQDDITFVLIESAQPAAV